MKLRTSDLRDSLEKEIVNYKGKMKIVKGLEKKQQVYTSQSNKANLLKQKSRGFLTLFFFRKMIVFEAPRH